MFLPYEFFISGWNMIVRMNVVLNRTVTVVVDSDWGFDNLWGSHLQSQKRVVYLQLMVLNSGYWPDWSIKSRCYWLEDSWCHWCVSILLLLQLRESIHKSGPADLAQKIDFAYFLYTERLSCPYTKTTICLIRSFTFIELWEIFWSPQRTLVATHIKAQI